MTPQQIVAQALSFLGVKWVHQGRSRDGVDCVGLIALVLLACGWKPRNPRKVLATNYDRVSPTDYVLESMRGEAEEIVELHNLAIGDVVVFKFATHRYAQHCGIVTRVSERGLYFVHADADPKNKKVVEEKLVEEWRARFVAGFRMEYDG